MSKPVAITVFPDGPIKVVNPGSVVFCGNAIETDGDVFLCRCGESANAPFCDGSHNKVGFSGAKEAKEPKEVKVWEGQTVRTFFNPNTCMHVFTCKPLKELREAELAGDSSAAEEIMRVVNLCPSGALSYELKGEQPEPEATEGPAIEIMEGGEIRIRGKYEINEELAERQCDDRATLCRCGQSANKPWCDGRHKRKRDFR